MREQIRIGGVGCEVRWAEGHGPSPHAFYTPFADDGPVDLTLTVRRARAGPPAGRMLIDHFPDWEIRQDDATLIYELFHQQPPHARTLWARASADGRQVEVWVECAKDQPLPNIGGILGTLGRLLFIRTWQACGAQLVHGCAVDDHGVGRVFIGASGTGKSTLAGWYQQDGATVLTDESVVLRPDGDRWLAYGTPWPGLRACTQPGPVVVEGIYCLHQAPSHQLVPLSPSAATGLVLPQRFMLQRDAAQMTTALAWCEALWRAVPIVQMDFAKDAGVVSWLRTAQRPAEAVPGGVYV